ncbi:TonB-dependent receptor family protein [Mucilaginibacter sp. BJC16-A38]|uniref:TonB-dependent receptor n=1 Tax=Mucilaginibacter phenanthrenivorans TaxID=1234842 RepID=UPI0021576CC6|nr:TonB-dependent receptor [Mucilaginibacter phenanthrenivorans]MCR8559337.1 TonB-dependent receptor family protein [Mucilaginibacter phenanthrenivorans]
MTKNLYATVTVLAIILLSFTTSAQQIKRQVKGKLVDEAGKAIDYATISVVNAADSLLEKSAVSDKNGAFEISDLKNGSYRLIASRLGLKNYVRAFTITTAKPAIDFGALTMVKDIRNLNEVAVKGEKAPVTIKKDTVEFNAGSFKTQANDNLEQLLKKIPGMDVDKDGKVTTGGKDVKKVMVDGREFFGNDPKAATKNLPADAIDKVQVIDDKTDKTKNTGIDDGQRDKVVNVTLKADKKKGWFGNATAAGGTQDRYLGQFNLNHFDNKKQLSFLFLSNNVNESGFSFDDLNNFTGGNVFDAFSSGNGSTSISINSSGRANVNGAFSGVNDGLITNHSGGINYSDIYGKKEQLKFNVNLISVISSNKLVKLSDLQDNPNNLFTKQLTGGNNTLNSYRLNFSFDYKMDSLTNLKFKPSISTTLNKNNSSLFSNTLNGSMDSVNNISQMLNGRKTSPAYGGQFSVNHKLHNGKGSVNFFANGNYSKSDYDYTNISSSRYFASGQPNSDLNQQASQDNNATFFSGTASYVRQLSAKQKVNLTLSQSFDYRKQIADQYTLDYNGATGKYEIIDPLLSGNFNNRNWRYTTTAGLNKSTDNITVNVNFAVADLGLQGDFTSNNKFSTVKRDAFALVPNATFSYRKQNGPNLYLSVGTDVTLPSATDLQPVFNNTDPLYIKQGNPNLVMSRSLNTNVNYNYFDLKNNYYFNFYGNFTPTWNGFSTASTIDANGITTSKPINTDGNYSSNFGFNFGKPTKIKGLKLNIGLNGSVNRFVNFINDNENAVRRFSPGLSLGSNYDNDVWQLTLRTYSTYSSAKNSFQSMADQHYFTYNNSFTASVKPIKDWRIFSDVTQRLFRGTPASANTSFYIWNAGLERTFLKKQNLTFSLNAFDILNQNSGIQRNITTTGIVQNDQTNTIGRYFYVKLIYKITKVGAPAKSTPGIIIIK